jgi:hypothetical protein
MTCIGRRSAVGASIVLVATGATLAHLRRCFDPAVARRGDGYAADGRVTIIKGTPSAVTAVVEGTDEYAVAVFVEPHGALRRAEAECTCPYFEDDLCKHIWATIVAAHRRGHLVDAKQATGVVPRLETGRELVDHPGPLAAADDDDDFDDGAGDPVLVSVLVMESVWQWGCLSMWESGLRSRSPAGLCPPPFPAPWFGSRTSGLPPSTRRSASHGGARWSGRRSAVRQPSPP